ncbi:MAG: UDP-N-acetylglucosamine 1-carboxyvinyltransferase [Dethiobacteria bacterium]|nr:UDP-N-acetylglucosamine 1-carboxyvinyltransferase [Bacillota bacterium]
MSRIIIEGGIPLKGRVRIQGSKNASLPIMAACLLTQEAVELEGVPDLEDVRTMSHLLKHLGVKLQHIRQKERIKISKWSLQNYTAPHDYVHRMRASFLVTGPLLARFGRVKISLPGGCAIGNRPIDLHLKGLTALGAEFSMENGYIEAEAKKLQGTKIYLDYPSVGATENIMMAATLAEGTTVLENAAAEPEIVDLANFLNALGARVSGAGTSLIRIEGVSSLHGTHHTIIPDRIEAGTFMIAAAISKGEIILENVLVEHLKSVIAKLQEAGVYVEEIFDGVLHVAMEDKPRPLDIKTLPYPGFPTDLQPQFMALLTLANGTSVITETVFENRFMHVEELCRMGAQIRIDGRNAIIKGVESLRGAPVYATDLRAGAALVLAATAAQGVTEIRVAHHIDRGYANFDQRLLKLGARLRRTERKVQVRT